MTVSIVTLGCKVNQCESASIAAALKSCNLTTSEGLVPADVYVLNTCSVTAEADKKSRQYLSKMRKLNPNCHIIVVGCSSQNKKFDFSRPNVCAIGGTVNKSKFVTDTINKIALNDNYNTLSDIILYDENIEKIDKTVHYCYENYQYSCKTRAFIKIQDGCNRFCSYCIIPYLRGRSRSRSIEDIVAECKTVGSKEIVLTGIDMSYYGKDIGITLSDLLRSLACLPVRKRLGSLECEVIDDVLLNTMREGDCCPHFHLSLQSGSDAVLRSMNRRYNTEFYYNKVGLIREYFPLAGITTDIIVGFPTETEEYFEESVRFIERCKFSDIHVFPYSSRSGTLAARKYKPLQPSIVKERVQELLKVKNALRDEFMLRNVGTNAPVYVEDREGAYNVGYTPNYIKVYSDAPCGKITELKLVSRYSDGMLGVVGNTVRPDSGAEK